MTGMIFVNLPVPDVEKSAAFYEAVGFKKDPRFSKSGSAAAMAWSDAIVVMILSRAHFRRLLREADHRREERGRNDLALPLDSRQGVDAIVDRAVAAGGRGWSGDPRFWQAIGLLLLAITALYAWPRTAVLGAVLLTGYLGGALATHLRIGSPLFSHTLFGVYLGIATWGGLWLRNPRVRSVLPVG